MFLQIERKKKFLGLLQDRGQKNCTIGKYLSIYQLPINSLHPLIKKLVQNNFYQVQLINNISFEKKERQSYYDRPPVNLIFCRQFFQNIQRSKSVMFQQIERKKKFPGPLKDRGQKTFTLYYSNEIQYRFLEKGLLNNDI